MNAISRAQNALHADLQKYVNGGCLSRMDAGLSLLAARAPFVRNADEIALCHRRFSDLVRPPPGPPECYTIAPYRGTNRFVEEMSRRLERELRDDLVCSFVAGSLGTAEEIPYSDFDALVIVRDRVFSSPARLSRAAHRLSKLRGVMYRMDPLQHHGWFVLTECDLLVYCSAYFPEQLFERSRALLPASGFQLAIWNRCSTVEALDAFSSVAEGLRKKLSDNRDLKNIYQLKSLMSGFMLLPSLYVQAMTGKGIFKKNSFALARADFASSDWAVMDNVSELRLEWKYELSPPRRWMLTRTSVLRGYVGKKLAPGIAVELQRKLAAGMLAEMHNLVMAMIRNVETTRKK